MNNKLLGFNLELELASQDGTEYLAGETSCIAEIPLHEREKFLPAGEVQKGAEDTMDCATRAPLNILETKLNWLLQNNLLPESTRKWLFDNDYLEDNQIKLSDRYIAILSGTTRQGNSLKAPFQAMHEYGVIPKYLLPLREDMTWDEYHDPKRITTGMKKLGQEFLKRFKINYNKETEFKDFLSKDMISVAVHAWSNPINGIYPRTEETFNHAVDLWKPEYFIFDNYRDSYDGDFVKELAPNYKFMDYGYRLAININEVIDKKKESIGIIQKILNLCQSLIDTHLFDKHFDKPITMPEPTPQPIPDAPQATPSVPTPPKYDWSTPEKARHSLRVICDEEKLPVYLKNQLCETVRFESGFNPKAININRDKTKDCGIAQLSQNYYLKTNKLTCEEAINDPERCIRIMCRAFKAGRQRDWIAWRKLYENNMNKKFGAFSSSVDPQQLSLTIKGVVSFAVVTLGLFKIDLPQTEVDNFVEGLLAVITGGMVVWGVVRKIIVYFKNKNEAKGDIEIH